MIFVSEEPNERFEVVIDNLSVQEIQHQLSKLMQSFTWEMPKDYILDSVDANLTAYLNFKNKDNAIVSRKIIIKPSIPIKKKITNQDTQLSLFD
jgi:hypothetical protein